MHLFVFFLIGIILFSSFQYFPFSSISVFFLSIVFLAFKRKFVALFMILLGIGLALLHYEQPKDLSYIAGKEAVVKGTAQSYPVETAESGMFRQTLCITSVVDSKTGEKLKDLEGQEISLLSHEEFELGVEYEIVITFLNNRTRLNPGSLMKNEIHAKLIEINSAEQKKISLNSEMQELRYKLNSYNQENFNKDSAAFITAMTTGQRTLMDEDLRNAFNATGLAHILSISGTHFGLFSVFLFSIFRFIVRAFPYKVLQRITIFLTPSQAAAMLSFPFMLAYFGLSGGSIPAARSFIMISLVLLGLLIGRKGLWLNALLFAACVLTLWEPRVILDLSFQLSFLAVLFIGFTMETREDKAKQEGKFSEEKKLHVMRKFTGHLRNPLLLTLSASIGTAPLVAYHFHYFSIISPLSNLLITPLIGFILIPLSLFSSFLFLLTGYHVFTPVVSAVSDMSISLVRLFSDLPFADIKIPAFPILVVLLFYMGFLVYFLSGRKRYTLIIPFIPILFYLFFFLTGKRDISVTYLDVGQGDSAVIELPDQKIIVIDTGRNGRETASYLKYTGKETVDALVLSHIHPDHTGGLDFLVKRFRIKELWDNGRMILPENIMSYVGDKRRILQRGDEIEGKGYAVYILHPYPEFYSIQGNEYVGANNDSLVIRITGMNSSFLFTGDVEEEAEEDLSSLGKILRSDVIKVPHHGGKTSACKPFFELVSPKVAVISLGRDNTFGHPHDEMIDTLEGGRILRTDLDGAVKIKESNNGLEIKTFRDFQLERTRSFPVELQNIRRLLQTW